MNKVKLLCEKGFGVTGGWAFRHYWLALLLVISVTVLLGSQLPNLTMDTRNETFFHPEDQVLLDYNSFRDQYGKDEFIVLAVTHPELFSFDFLTKLNAFHQQLEKDVPYLDEVTSLINVRNTRGDGDELIVEDFLEQWPKNEQELMVLRERAMESELYRNFILSEDGTMTSVIIKPLACNPEGEGLLGMEGSCQPMSNEQNREMMAGIEKVITTFESESFPIAVSGMPAVVDRLNCILEEDFAIILPAMFLLVIVFLFIMFRRITGVIYPLLLFILSLISAISLMAILKIPMTNITIILPSLMLVVSISDAVHILALFYPEYQKSGKREESLVMAMEHSGLAVFMTTLTTAAGLLSFAIAEVAPVADLGIVAPIGVFLALFYTVFLLPALLAVFPLHEKQSSQRYQKINRLFTRISRFTCEQRWGVITLFLMFLCIGVVGISKLEFSHLALRWFSEESQIRKDTEYIDKKLRGTVSLDVIIDTGEPGGLYDPEFIQSLEQATEKYSEYEHQDLFVGKILDLTTIIKESNRALHENRSDNYVIPEDRKLLAQELFLFQLSGSDDLEELADQQFSQTRLAMHLPYRDSAKFRHFITYVSDDLKARYPKSTITVTGVNALFIEMLNNVMSTMLKSYTMAIVCISLLMILMLGKLRLGLLSMVPNFFPIVMVLGLMGWFGIPLDFGTILIGSISLGIIVDDTIHFLHNFSRYHDEEGDTQRATNRSLQTVGRAMFVTSVVLMGGFLSNMLSGLTLNQYSGFLIASTVCIALITDFLLVPALLTLIYGNKEEVVDMVKVTS